MRGTIEPEIKNAFITFRSMEGKHRALQAFYTPTATRVCAENFCCMDTLFKARKLLRKGHLSFEETVDPANVVWENMATSTCSTLVRGTALILCAAVVVVLSYVLMYRGADVEVVRNSFVKSDCTGLPVYTEASAIKDHESDGDRQGLLHCYFSQFVREKSAAEVDKLLEGNSKVSLLFAEWYQNYYRLKGYTSYFIATCLILMNLVIQGIFYLVGDLYRNYNVSTAYKWRIFVTFFT